MNAEAETPKIDMTPIEGSSQIESIGYDAPSKTLAVTFINGHSTYHYHNVPPEEHAALMGAESKGSHLGKNIKGKYRFKKIGAPSSSKPTMGF